MNRAWRVMFLLVIGPLSGVLTGLVLQLSQPDVMDNQVTDEGHRILRVTPANEPE